MQRPIFMSYNNGFYCQQCGPQESAKKKTIAKVARLLCEHCESPVTPWKRPLTERAGRCNNCGHAAFTLAVVKRQLLRCCKHCQMVVNTDNKQTIREGAKP